VTLYLKPSIASAIDSQIWKIYKNRLGGNELTQLAKLFKRSGLATRLKSVLSPTLPTPRPSYSEDLEISLAWIDKRPLAKLATQPKRVELGDAAILFFDVLRIAGTNRYRESRALILQAKAAQEKRQIAQPSVPVNPTRPSPSSSTARELALLSRWGTFDLYKTSGSSKPIVRAISVAPSKLPPANGWYMATPKRPPGVAQHSAWKSPWMCGPAADGSPCNVTLGSLLLAFLTSSPINSAGASLPEVGVKFSFDPQYLLSPQGNDWDRLCIELLRLCPQNKLPKSLFGARAGTAIKSTILRSLPYGGSESGRNLLSWLRDLLFPRRMPILLIAIIRNEGPG
jgi:hypothetical protein